MCFFFEMRCLCCDETFVEKLCLCHGHSQQKQMCLKNHTVDGFPLDVSLNDHLPVSAINMHDVLQEWSICRVCLSIGQYRYLPGWMSKKIGQRIVFRYIPWEWERTATPPGEHCLSPKPSADERSISIGLMSCPGQCPWAV
jgi:hypothetical protein